MIRNRRLPNSPLRSTFRPGIEQLEDRTVPSSVDVSVVKTTPTADSLGNVNAGQPIQYQIVVANAATAGGTATGVTLNDVLPTGITGASWTATTAGGAAITTNGGTSGGTIHDVLSLPAGSSITYTVNGTLSGTAAGTLQNTATATPSAADTDTDTANNTSSVSNHVVPVNDVSVTKTDNAVAVGSGGVATYTIVVKNTGQTALTNVSLTDVFAPTLFTSETWTSAASAGASGNTASGTGDITETALNLAPGATVTYTVRAQVATGLPVGSSVTNTATVSTPLGVTDNDLSNNAAADTDLVAPAFFNQYAVGADAGAQGHVKVYTADGAERLSFLAFPGFDGGVRVATGDVTGDGVNDIIVGAGFGANGGHVKVFDGVTGNLIASFFSFDTVLGGVYVAAGDINHDGRDEVIVGSGLGSGHVMVFSLNTGTPVELYSYFAYPGYIGGITVASADVNGDGFDDIVTGTEENSHLKVFSLATATPVLIFSQIILPGYTGGIDVAAGNVRGDGRAEFLAAPLAAVGGAGGAVRVYSIDSTSPIASFTPGLASPGAGLRVGVADANNDGANDILVANGFGQPALVQAYDGTSFALVKEITAFEDFLGGVYVSP
jgi:uncharacterized repeat protein (TIGR01451 family)